MNFLSIGRGILGIAILLGIAVLLSKNRRKIQWNVVVTGLALQIILAAGIMYVPFIQNCFEFAGKIFVKVMDFTRTGTEFIAGGLLDKQKVGYVFIFQVLPTIIFFSALTSLLYYLHIIQIFVKALAWCLRRIFRISGAEGLTVAGNIFLGQCEAPLLAKGYLQGMNRSEIFLVMTAGMATIAGAVMSAYVGMLGGNDPQVRILFARYLISASVMAAPGAIVLAKIIIPQTEPIQDGLSVNDISTGDNILDAISKGTVQGLKLAVTVAALLLSFIAMVAFFNYLSGDIIGKYTGLNNWLSEICGKPVVFNFQTITGWLFTPLAWVMGVDSSDITNVGSLLGTKIILNEFVAYTDLNILKNAGAFMQEKSIIIATFALCGFANISSIGMQIGGIGVLAPNQRKRLTEYGFLAMISGMLASCLSATIVGMLIS